MTNIKYLFLIKHILFIAIGLMSFSCSNTEKEIFPNPQIKAGVVKIHGKLNDPQSQLSSLILRFQNPVTASESIVEAQIEKNGNFYFETPAECSTVFSSIYSPGFGGVILELTSDEDIKVELDVDSSGKLQLNSVTGKNFLTKQDEDNYGSVLGKYITYHSNDQKYDPKMTPDEFKQYQMNWMKVRTEYAMKDVEFSDAGRNFVFNELKLLQAGTLLEYQEGAELLFTNSSSKNPSENWSPPDPEIQYYAFLKSFELNNPQYLYSPNGYYHKIMQILLSVKAFDIPPISEMSVEDWLCKVKTTLSGLVGFDKGLFYDLLAANSYAMQFNDGVTPLSDKQKDNIKEYFGDGEIAKILLRRNENIIKIAEEKSGVVVNKTPDVPKEQLMNTIISKYKNKTVLVDFWATWCSPCLDAIVRIDAIKSQLKGKNIIFVYITNGSSPEETWNKKIKSIPGEHYYVNADEWDYLMKNFEFSGIPSYVIFDKKGEARDKFTAYPGNEKMQAMIEELLK